MITLGNNISNMERPGRGRLVKDVPQGNNFGAWLRARRLERHLTGEALAFAIGGSMTQGRVSAYERGHKKPGRDTAVKIATALGADPGDALRALMFDTPGMEAESHTDTSVNDLYALILSLAPEDRETMRHVGQRLAQGKALR